MFNLTLEQKHNNMINRFDRNARYDWSFNRAIEQLPQINFDGLNQVMQSVQADISQPDLISQMQPKVLNTTEDRALYNEYKQSVDNQIQSVRDAYGRSLREGTAAKNKLLQDVKSEWQPGGRAQLLNSRYDNYLARQKELEDFYKSDKRGVNKDLALRTLNDELNQPIGYDPTTRSGKSDFKTELVADPDIRKAVDDMLKEIKESGDTQFLGDQNKDWWLTKIKTEGRPAEKIKLAFEALSQQPEFASQIGRDALYQKYRTDPVKYQDAYNKQLDAQIKGFEDLAQKAKSDPKSARELQQLLNENGSNLTEDGQYGPATAAEFQKFIDSQKQVSSDLKSGFNLDNQLTTDVRDSYLNYALRGAYTKVDKDLVYNKALEARQKLANDREANKINRDRLNFEMKAQPNSDIFVGSGVAQQTPKLFDYAESVKKNAESAKESFQKVLNTSVFKGWTPENIAQAYDLWEKSNGDRATFEQSLRSNSSFPFSDKQVDAIVTELQLPTSESGVKSMMETMANADADNRRLQSAMGKVGVQYSQTPEGKSNIQSLNRFRLNGESDENLIQRALSNPEQFVIDTPTPKFGGVVENKPVNVANLFKTKMQSDIKNQEKAGQSYNWSDALGTYEVYAGKSDKTLRPVLDNFMTFAENSNGKNIISFGSTTLKFQDADGKQLNPDKVDIKRIAVAKNIKGEPVLKISGDISRGQKSVQGFSEVAIVPGSPEHAAITKSLQEAYISKYTAGELRDAEGILDNIEALQGMDGVRQSAGDLLIGKLNSKNTQLQNITFVGPTGKIENMADRKWRTSVIGNPINVNGFTYQQVGVLPPDSKPYTALVVESADGYTAVPGLDGSTLFKSTSDISKLLTAKQVLAGATVEATKSKR